MATSSTTTVNPELGKLFRSIETETTAPVCTDVKGDVPTWINGCLLRNGPGKYEIGEQQMNHQFDGLSMLHQFDIADGKVTYRNRMQESDAYILGREKNRLVLDEFATYSYPDPCLNIFQRMMARFQPKQQTDNFNVNWYQYGDEFYVCSEGTVIRKIDPETLKSKGKISIPEALALHTATAHPHTASDGTLYNMGSTYGRKNRYCIVKTPPPTAESGSSDAFEQVSILTSITPSVHYLYPSYYHTFGLTENYLVFLEQPLLINLFKIMKTYLIPNLTFGDAFEFHTKLKAKFHIIQRSNGETIPIHCEADAFMCFHHINAYEDNGHVVVDMVCHPDDQALKNIYMKYRRKGVVSNTQTEARRYVLPLDIKGKTVGSNLNGLSYSKAKSILGKDDTIHCSYDVICDQAVELPTINYSTYNGKIYRYFYGVSGKDDQTLIKADTMNCSSVEWYEDSCFGSEPIFVERPGSTAEDDGVVLSAVIDIREGHQPFLLILDARDFKEIGRAMIPAEISFSLHGIFVTRSALLANKIRESSITDRTTDSALNDIAN